MARFVFAALRIVLVRIEYDLPFAHPTVRALRDLRGRHWDRVADIDFRAQMIIIHAA